jgi:AcrR family transcriptional regulator
LISSGASPFSPFLRYNDLYDGGNVRPVAVRHRNERSVNLVLMNMTTNPRERLLTKASELFYQDGIHAVGVDRLVAEAGVTRATFYRHFPSKDDLVAEYLRTADHALRRLVDQTEATSPPEAAVLAVLDLVGQRVSSADFRGCEFINAAAEYPDPAHPVRAAVADHRTWFRQRMEALSRAAGHRDPEYAASLLVLLHDGGLAAGELDDPVEVRATVSRAVRELFSTSSLTSLTPRSACDAGPGLADLRSRADGPVLRRARTDANRSTCGPPSTSSPRSGCLGRRRTWARCSMRCRRDRHPAGPWSRWSYPESGSTGSPRWPKARGGLLMARQFESRTPVVNGTKTTTVRWDDPIAVGPATFVFEDNPENAALGHRLD